MITKITDKAARDTTLAWTFAIDDGISKACIIDFSNAAGLKTTYDRSVATGICAIANWDGATLLSKFANTPVTGGTGRPRRGTSANTSRALLRCILDSPAWRSAFAEAGTSQL